MKHKYIYSVSLPAGWPADHIIYNTIIVDPGSPYVHTLQMHNLFPVYNCLFYRSYLTSTSLPQLQTKTRRWNNSSTVTKLELSYHRNTSTEKLLSDRCCRALTKLNLQNDTGIMEIDVGTLLCATFFMMRKNGCHFVCATTELMDVSGL